MINNNTKIVLTASEESNIQLLRNLKKQIQNLYFKTDQKSKVARGEKWLLLEKLKADLQLVLQSGDAEAMAKAIELANNREIKSERLARVAPVSGSDIVNRARSKQGL